jgi:hypothetical protein
VSPDQPATCAVRAGGRGCPNEAVAGDLCQWHGRADPAGQPGRTRLYLGAPEPSMLFGAGLHGTTELAAGLALFVSYGRLQRLADPMDWFAQHRQRIMWDGLEPIPWALDSGAFTEISQHGAWRQPVDRYVQDVAWIDAAIPGMEWAAPQDLMCEDDVLATTGRTELEHQIETVDRYVRAAAMWPDWSNRPCPFIPVLQARPGNVAGRARHVRMYEQAGVDLRGQLVGVGSVCREQSTSAIVDTFELLEDLGIRRCHYFGLKREGLRRVNPWSADSMAWSLDALHAPPLPGHSHQHCVSCIEYGRLWWSQTVLQMLQPAPVQRGLWSLL